jgi:hypothetical protein
VNNIVKLSLKFAIRVSFLDFEFRICFEFRISNFEFFSAYLTLFATNATCASFPHKSCSVSTNPFT